MNFVYLRCIAVVPVGTLVCFDRHVSDRTFPDIDQMLLDFQNA